MWLRQRGDAVVATTRPSPVGPLRSRRTAQLAARALTPGRARPSRGRAASPPPPAARARRRSPLRGCRTAPRPDRSSGAGLPRARAPRSRATARVLRARPGRRARLRPRVLRRQRPGRGGATLPPAVARARGRSRSRRRLRPQKLDLDELLLLESFLRRPPPELRVAPLEREAILGAARRLAAWHRDTSSSKSSATPSPQFTLPTG